MARLAWGELPTRLPVCSECQRPFTTGDFYVSALKGEAARGYERTDFCVNCWEAPGEKKRSSVKGFWRAQLSPKEKQVAIQAAWTERGLLWLRDQLKKEELDKPAVYVLAMLLTREKVLALRQEIQGLANERLQLYEVLETEELLAVPKLEASKLCLESIQLQLQDLLNT